MPSRLMVGARAGSNPRSRWPLAAVFVAAVLITLVFQWTLPTSWRPSGTTDYASFYGPVAHNLLAGQGYHPGGAAPATTYPPGYPIALAGVFWLSDLLGARQEAGLAVFAALAMGFAAVLLYALARRLWSSPAALVAPLLLISYPFALWLTSEPNPEMPFLVAFYGAWYAFWSAALRRSPGCMPYFACGLLIGIAMLIRPIAIGLGFVLGVLLLLTRRDLGLRARGLLVGALLAGNLVAVLPWELWLYHRTARVQMLCTNGVASMRDGLTFAVYLSDYREPVRVPGEVEALMRDVLSRSSEARSLGDLASLVGAELRTRPRAVAELIALKAARSWYGANSGRHERAILLVQAGYLLLLLWAAYAAWRRGGTERQFAAAVGVLVLYFWGMTVLALSILRYMVPVIGLAFLLVPALAPLRRPAKQQREASGPAGERAFQS